jgi:2-C-methyl-D-erythritol 4-phosphate cytidylyltransferase
MGLSQPKQFEMLNGKTILEHSVDTFEKHPNIDGIYIVVHADFIESTKQLLNIGNRPKIKDVIAGGEERTDSSHAAITKLHEHVGATSGRPDCTHPPAADTNLLIHDAARPFITQTIITQTIDALKTHSAVSVAIPATDTIYLCDDDQKIQSSPQRKSVYLAQTPQAARLSLLKQAFELAQKNQQHIATDDANVILNYLPDTKIYIVPGDQSNRKITYQSDLN